MNSNDVRESAYAELVVGLIDARDRAAEDRFDAELDAAVRGGRVDPSTARTLRWWQRESLRAVVSQAEQVVPPTLAALEAAARELRERTAAQPGPSTSSERLDIVDVDHDERADLDVDLLDDDVDAPQPRHALPPPVDLTARRLLVAGLTHLRDP